MAGTADDVVLEPRTVGEVSGEFVVPSYQRGYRWGATEVTRLLNDIHAAGDSPYYLQPVVVLPRGDSRWDVVDGQQRLTTLHLLQRYLQAEVLPTSAPTWTMSYDTRPGSQGYLATLDEDRRFDNIDFFHMRAAYDAITEWFDGHGSQKLSVGLDVYQRLQKTVTVIWYQASDTVDPITLFTRLNVGRIPLTDAELVKAVLLSRSRLARTDRSLEVAAQWDAVERDLRQPEVWAFVAGSDADTPTHISLLLDTLAGGPTEHRAPFHTFETLRQELEMDALRLWERVLDLHALVMGWYADRDFFHLVGFLVATGTPFPALVALAEDRTKTELRAALVERITQRIRLDEGDVRDLSYRDSTRVSNVLLLMNVETARTASNPTERYSFAAHAGREWSLEHIHAQNAEPLTRAEQWTAWVDLHAAVVRDHPTLEPAERDRLLEQMTAARDTITQASFRAVEREVLAVLSPREGAAADDVDSIANLALLSSGDNTALSNSVFEVKRREVLRRDREGAYVPACTRNVFLKYYTDNASQQSHFWSVRDQESYLAALVETVRPYLKESDA